MQQRKGNLNQYTPKQRQLKVGTENNNRDLKSSIKWPSKQLYSILPEFSAFHTLVEALVLKFVVTVLALLKQPLSPKHCKILRESRKESYLRWF